MTAQIWSLLEVCSFCFEKNETIEGWSRREVPFRNQDLARRAFAAWSDEAFRLWGAPRDLAARADAPAKEWPGRLRIGVSGCLVRVLVAAPNRDAAAFAWGEGDPDWKNIQDDDWRLAGAPDVP